MARDVHKTFCRICEALCGLEVEVTRGRATAVRPDPSHPISRGYACIKGVQLGALHDDPDRLDWPEKRVGNDWQRIGWDQAIAEIGARVRSIRSAHGADAVGGYIGNPTFFNFKSFLFSQQFLAALGSPNLFASHSIDCNNKFDVAHQMYGLPTIHPVPDFDRLKMFLCLGANPAVTQMSFVQAPDALGALRAIEARGGRVVLVDPRRTETARRVGEHLAIRPGTDAYLLAALVAAIFERDLVDRATVERVSRGLEALEAAVRPWTAERVAPVTGLDAHAIRELAEAFATADGAAAYMSTGVNMGPFGSLAYWLVQALNLVTGNIDRAGGLLVPRGPLDLHALSSALGLGRPGHRRAGRHAVVDALPVGGLADAITGADGEPPVRALFVSAGNPVHSVPGSALADALRELELLVCIDIYPSETSELAHYRLPATDMLERSDFTLTLALNQVTPNAQYTPAVLPPKAARREEWQIFSELAVACGARPLGASICNAWPHLNRWLTRLPGAPQLTPDHLLALALRAFGDVSLRELRDNPSGVLLPPVQPGSFLGKRVRTSDGMVALAPERILADLPRLDAEARVFGSDDDTLQLIGRREKRSHNSWMHNNPGIRQPSSNAALLHPSDAEARGIRDGDRIELRCGERAVELTAALSDELRPGVVCVPHGWGHASSGLGRARSLGGANINEVIPGGVAALEPVSGQAIMSAVRVQVRPARAPADAS